MQTAIKNNQHWKEKLMISQAFLNKQSFQLGKPLWLHHANDHEPPKTMSFQLCPPSVLTQDPKDGLWTAKIFFFFFNSTNLNRIFLDNDEQMSTLWSMA